MREALYDFCMSRSLGRVSGQVVAVVVLVLLTTLTASSAGADVRFPLKVAPNGRYLVDQDGVPFLIAGESPQALIGKLRPETAAQYLDARRAQGFNALWINLLCGGYGDMCNADFATIDGIPPFLTPGDLATPNEAYFAFAESMLQLAVDRGFLIILDPIETGSWLDILKANGVQKARQLGQFLGARFQHIDNIIWMHGNDFQTWHNDKDAVAVVQAVALGIQDTDARHIHTVELDYYNSNSLDDPTWGNIIRLNAAYTYDPTYREVLEAYNVTLPGVPTMPVFMVEATYEGERGSGPELIRAQPYWTNLSGATGGLFGNHFMWGFFPDWQNNLDTVGVRQFSYATQLFTAYDWWELVPDQNHTVVTDGLGDPDSANRVTAARSPAGNLAIAYIPSPMRTITINLSSMGGLVDAHWFDPTNGTFAAVLGSPFSNVGARALLPPGPNSEGAADWVLVLEATPPLIPTLSTLSPHQVLVGSQDVTITAFGTRFDENTVLQVNGGPRPTTVMSATWLTASLTAEDVADVGTLSITVSRPGIGSSNALTLEIRNPLPVLTTVTPARSLRTTEGLTLALVGHNFVQSSIARWKGADRATEVVSSTQLNMTLQPGDLAVAGTAAVTVFTPTPGGGTTPGITFTIDAPGKVAFTTATTTVDETAASVTLTVTRTAGVGGPVTVEYATADGSAHDGVDYQARSGTLTYGIGDTSRTVTVPIIFTSGGATSTFTVGLSNPTGGLALGAIPVATVVIRNAVATLTSFTPAAGPVGTVVTLTGANLPLASSVGFGGANTSSVTIVSPTSIRVPVPDGATTAPVGILSPAGNPVSATAFRVLPKVTSVTPDEGEVGDVVTLAGSNLAGATAVRFGAALAAINGSSYGALTVTVPATATTSTISVTTPDGTAVSPAPFVVVRTPTITSFSPATAPEGATVTLSGANLATVTAVSFNGVSASPITVLSSTSIRAAVPGGATTGRVTATNVAGVATSPSDFKVAPSIVSVTPAQGTPGTLVVITGTTLSVASLTGPVATVRFGAMVAGNVSGSSTTLTAFVPLTATSGRITVTTPGGTATSASDFVVVRPPTIASVSPSSGPVGSVVTITGTNLGSVTSATVNGLDAGPVTVLSPTSIRITVPGGATSGKIGVTNPSSSAISAAAFTLTPAITGLSPARGEPGTSVTISGTTLGAASLVRFGAIAAPITGNSSTQLTVTVPSSAASGPVTVVTPTGTTASVTAFTVVRTPTITGLAPARGPVGSAVIISGASVGTAAGVTFTGAAGDVSAAAMTVLSASSVQVVVPDGAALGPITVSNEAGRATSALAFTPTPRVLSLTPARGQPGATVTIAGSNLDGASVVKFGAVVAGGLSVAPDGRQITATVPASAVTGKVSVTTPAGAATSLTDFVVVRAPAIASFAPASGPEGTLVTVTGANLAGASSVAFNGANTTAITILAASSIRVAVPAGATTGRLGAADEVGSALSAGTFTVTPRIVSIPAAGLPGAAVTIMGTSLGNTSVVRFGGMAAAGFTIDGPTQITATVPATALSGKITLTTPAGTATSPTDFTVIRPPVLSSFTPASAPVGALVTLTGPNLGTVSAVAFGNVSTTSITVLSATSIRVAVPAGAVTGRLTATNPAASAQSTTPFVLAPKLTGFDVASGADDDTVSLLGSGLSGTTLVKFGTVSAAFTVVSDVEISAIVPAAAVTGRVSVTTPGGIATSPTDFLVTAPDPT